MIMILCTEGLSKRFGKNWVVKDLNLEVHRVMSLVFRP